MENMGEAGQGKLRVLILFIKSVSPSPGYDCGFPGYDRGSPGKDLGSPAPGLWFPESVSRFSGARIPNKTQTFNQEYFSAFDEYNHAKDGQRGDQKKQ